MAAGGACARSCGMQDYQLGRPLIDKHIDDEKMLVLRIGRFCVAGCCFFAFIWALAAMAAPPNFTLTNAITMLFGPEAARLMKLDAIAMSPKSKEEVRSRDDSPWNASALQSLRTAFHFQPPNHWMNDPSAPLYYKGWYHLFYQYNPKEAYSGLISWGHTISRDLIHWLYLEPLAMVPDHWYDQNGVWSGSATMVSDMANGGGGDPIPVILYTGSTNESVQVQNVAFPTDPSDVLLRNWTKIRQDPVLTPPPFINVTDFRDPTTAWRGNDGLWTTAIGSHWQPTHSGMALLYRSHDFVNWSLVPHTYLHFVNGTGMWECVDFYPVAASGEATGLDTSTATSSRVRVKHVLKASMDDSKLDFYTIGTYDAVTLRFRADDAALDLSLGFRYDYGRFYASKSFFDPLHHRRILFGWINESDTFQDDLRKGWAGIQSIPRQVWFDNLTNQSLIQWPIEEVTSLYTSSVSIEAVTLESGSIMKIEGGEGAQWDITLSFDKPQSDYWIQDSFKHPSKQAFSLIGCDQSGINHDSFFGPFGIYVLSSEDLQEQTRVYFYLVPIQATTSNMSWTTFVCNDLTRSSLASNLDKGIYGGLVTILEEEDELSVRILVDHSIVETFAQGGRTLVTSRVYPTIALDDSANLYLFNNASLKVFVKRFEAWRVSSIGIHDY